MKQDIVDKATRVVEENLTNPQFNIEMFAREMALCRTGLFDRIKEATGKTPNHFIVGIRLKKAADLLTSRPAMSVADISSSVGFNSPSYFISSFRRAYGMTPVQYRHWKNSGQNPANREW